MPKINRITNKGKKAITDLLNRAMQVEYGVILNYPRIIDQLIKIDNNTNNTLISNLEHLGKDSFRHSSEVSKLIDELGGKVMWEMVAIDVMIDVRSMLVEQLEKEKLAMATYENAKHIAQENQAKPQGFLDIFSSRRVETRDNVWRSKVIHTLNRLQQEELNHITTVKAVLLEIDTQLKKQTRLMS